MFAYEAIEVIVFICRRGRNGRSAEALAQGGQTSTYSRSYTYDAVGNRLTMEACVDGDCVATGYAYNDNNQIISETTDGVLTQYFYDANGNMIAKATGEDVTYYTYDVRNRLISVDDGVNYLQYEYDADNVRTAQIVNGNRTEYLVDKNRRYKQVLEERCDTGALLAEHTYGNQRIRMRREGVDRYYHYDGHGSVTGLTDMYGNITDTYAYSAHGNLVASTGISFNPYLYTGEAWDTEAGLQYLRARYYNPEIGRFMTMDPHPGNMRVPLSLNRYLYGNANPVMFVDPSGMFGIVSISISITIGGILASVALPMYVHRKGGFENRSTTATQNWGIMLYGSIEAGYDLVPGIFAVGAKTSVVLGSLWRRCPGNPDSKYCKEYWDYLDNTRDFVIWSFGFSAGAGAPIPVLPGSGGGGVTGKGNFDDYTPFTTPFNKDFEDFHIQSVQTTSINASFGYTSWDAQLHLTFPLLLVSGVNLSVPWKDFSFNEVSGFSVPGIAAGIQSGIMFLRD